MRLQLFFARDCLLLLQLRRRLLLLLLLFLLVALALPALRPSEATSAAGLPRRSKRFVVFRKGSTFFYRINYKLNTLPHSTMFAQASGFKVAWELPTTTMRTTSRPYRKGRSLSPGDIQDYTNLIYDGRQINGHMCLLKSLCQAMVLIKEKDGILRKIFKLLSGSYTGNNTSSLDSILCNNYNDHCPLHFLGFNVFPEN